MARVLIVSLVFAPDEVSTAELLSRLALELRDRGHDVAVVTTTPHHRPGGCAASAKLRPAWGRLACTSELDGIPVFHVRMRAKGGGLLGRAVDYAAFQLLSTLRGLIMREPYDVVFVPSPPLTMGLTGWLLARRKRAALIYNVQEIYPDIAERLGVVKSSVVAGALRRMERFIYKRAEAVVVIGDAFARKLARRGVEGARLHCIPNFAEADAFVPAAEDVVEFSRSHDLAGRFIVLYAGNVGLTQDFATLLDAAADLRSHPDVLFLVVGDGAKRRWLEAEVARRGTGNVRVLPFQPRSLVPALYACSHVGVIPMLPGTAEDTFPSKLYSLMASGRAVVVAAEPGTALAEETARSGCGRVVAPGDAAALAAALLELRDDAAVRTGLGERGRAFVTAHRTPRHAAEQYDSLIRRLAGPFDGSAN
jgi:colanic acid biosynthesis glycosyl transferase WcaI